MKILSSILDHAELVRWVESQISTRFPNNSLTPHHHTLALKSDGHVVAWGDNTDGQTRIPDGLADVVAIACGANHNLALKANRTVVGWGENSLGQSTTPAGLSDVVAVAAGFGFSLALKSDGTVVGWGDNSAGEIQIPNGLTNVVALASGLVHSLALKSDGTVVAWGINNGGQVDVPENLSNVVGIAAGVHHSSALWADVTVTIWGTYANETLLPGEHVFPTFVPAGLTNVVALAGEEYRTTALKVDGTLVTWRAMGSCLNILTNSAIQLSNVLAISHGVALVGNRPPLLHAPITHLRWDPAGFACSILAPRGKVFRLEHKNSVTEQDWIGLPLLAGNGGLLRLGDLSANGNHRFYRIRSW